MPLPHSCSPNGKPTNAWGADELSRFIDDAHANAGATCADDPERYGVLVEVEALYRRLIDQLGGTSEQLARTLLIRTHGLYLGAVSLALSGMVAEAYGVLHQSLKTALQGVFVAANQERQRLWIHRNDDDASRKRMQVEFKTANLLRHMRHIDSTTLAVCEKLLSRTRSHSEHSNAYGEPSRRTDAPKSSFEANQGLFVLGGEVQRYCLRSAAQVGICELSMYFYVFGEEYRATDMPRRLRKLRQSH